MKLKSFECENCHRTFERRNDKRVYRFCSKSCAQQVIAPTNRGYKPLMQKWIAEHGESCAVEMMALHLQKRSDATRGENNPLYGTHRPEATRQKLSLAAMGIPNALKGKTFVEFYGANRAKELRDHHSLKLKEGFASGRIKNNYYRASAPTFRGVRLRSQLEQRAIEFLELRDGVIFGQTLLYEDHSTFVQWIDALGKSHTYMPDFHDITRKIVYEVKPAWLVAKPTDEMLRKMSALSSYHRCAYLTDKDMK